LNADFGGEVFERCNALQSRGLAMGFSPNPLGGLVIGLGDGVLSAVSRVKSKRFDIILR